MTNMTAARPGVFDRMPAAEYHQRTELSSTGVRSLLRSPAHFRYQRDHPVVPTREMVLGTCVHTVVLGEGQQWAVTDSEDWRAKGARAQVEDIELQGLIAVKPSEMVAIVGMATAVRIHLLAGPLLHEDRGVPERCLIWTDEATGVDCRGLVDFSPHNRRCLVDLKTTGTLDPRTLGTHMARQGLPLQAAWYLRGARALGLADEDTEFVWVFVERDAPHLVVVCRLVASDLAWADERCTAALQRYRDCVEADVWPGYSEELQTISLPPWARRDYEEQPDEY